jgi:DNA-binding NtrC family response regulator
LAKPQILIVDDDQGTLVSLSRAFALEGYTALTASSAARGLERLAEEPVDAILSDVVMPEMDGLEFLARVRERAPDVPVILMSGQATVETAVKATRLGALDFVEKPVGLDRLLLTPAQRAARSTACSARTASSPVLAGRAGAHRRERPMAALRTLIERAAPSDLPVLDPRRERHGQGAGGARDPRAVARARRSRSSR